MNMHRLVQRVLNRGFLIIQTVPAASQSLLVTGGMNRSSSSGFHNGVSLAATKTSSKRRGHTVCIEGNIACGKTTLLEHFLHIPDVEVIQEPMHLWRNVRGHNPFGKMYEDPQRWGMALQTYIQLTMVDRHTRPQKEPVRLMERSIHSARRCFAENLFISGYMPEMEYVILDEWYQWILKTLDVHVDLIVYLHTSPEVCLERIQKRGRVEEMGIPLELLQTLHGLHEDWLTKKRFSCSVPVLTIDADGDLSNVFDKYREQEDIIMGKKSLAMKQ